MLWALAPAGQLHSAGRAAVQCNIRYMIGTLHGLDGCGQEKNGT